MKKLTISLLTTLIVSSFGIHGFANTNLQDYEKNLGSEVTEKIDLDNISLEKLSIRNTMKPRSVGMSYKRKLIKSQRKNRVFCGYVDTAWKYTDKYNSGVTYNSKISFSIFGVSIDIGGSKTANADIHADKNRLSRLALYADITFNKYKVEQYQGGGSKPIRTYYEVKPTYHNFYLFPKYK